MKANLATYIFGKLITGKAEIHGSLLFLHCNEDKTITDTIISKGPGVRVAEIVGRPGTMIEIKIESDKKRLLNLNDHKAQLIQYFIELISRHCGIRSCY